MRAAVQRHYDTLSFLYRVFWGEHIHHGFWPGGSSSPRAAQERLVTYLADRAGIARSEWVLDVGCGFGASGRWLADRLGCRVVGLTISRSQARFARTRNQRLRSRPVPAVVRADANRLPVAEATFDVVWIVECLEHLEDKFGFIREAATRLRPGGRLALCSWQAAGRRDREARALVDRVCEAFLCPSLATAEEHRRWCESTGLRVAVQEDLTARVATTWEILQRRTDRPWLQPVRRLVPDHVRRFVDGFPIIADAYERGAMSYGLVVAERVTREGGSPMRVRGSS